ncbi:MAG: cytochrome b/b6 domain-containing protein [Burkholderiales bacterium]|nr:cytochrome b/b6 domain-containing protein [Burkholderiales bacterium]
MLRNTTTQWGWVAKGFHWVMAALILVQVPLGVAARAWRVSPAKIELFFWHKSLGVLLLALITLRLVWRIADPAPALPAELPAWERAAARASHALLYVLLVLLPLTGWVVNAAANIPFRAFRVLPLPAIVGPDEAQADAFARVHVGLAIALVVVLVVHVAAALRHHVVRRNDVLERMLPRWGRSR